MTRVKHSISIAWYSLEVVCLAQLGDGNSFKRVIRGEIK